MKKPIVIRKRYIPDEEVDISRDEVLFRDETLLITRWKVIRPKPDVSGGVSFLFIDKGVKISMFLDHSNNFAYWYCDIVEIDYDSKKDKYVLTDMLVDVKILPDKTLQVLDLDELSELLENGTISIKQACDTINKLDNLLKTIYENEFPPKVCRKDKWYKNEQIN